NGCEHGNPFATKTKDRLQSLDLERYHKHRINYCQYAFVVKREIKNREDLSFLVRTFYAKIRADEEIGPFFNETITDWEEHLEKLTDFWETSLFGVRKYFGNPMIAHTQVDRNFGNRISANEFGIWLNLWFE